MSPARNGTGKSNLKAAANLGDVTQKIGAKAAWQHTKGKDVLIAIVDAGISGNCSEFPKWKQSDHWHPQGMAPWTDRDGHGTMCAAIAAGTTSEGGSFNGVAPDAQLMSCGCEFYDSELTAIYDALIEKAERGETVVTSNSFGHERAVSVPNRPGMTFQSALEEAIEAGVRVTFSAGNNHQLAGGQPDGQHPNSI